VQNININTETNSSTATWWCCA